jgi:hypothetical protein
MKILLVGAKFHGVDGRTDRHDVANCRFSQFSESAKLGKPVSDVTCCRVSLSHIKRLVERRVTNIYSAINTRCLYVNVTTFLSTLFSYRRTEEKTNDKKINPHCFKTRRVVSCLKSWSNNGKVKAKAYISTVIEFVHVIKIHLHIPFNKVSKFEGCVTVHLYHDN